MKYLFFVQVPFVSDYAIGFRNLCRAFVNVAVRLDIWMCSVGYLRVGDVWPFDTLGVVTLPAPTVVLAENFITSPVPLLSHGGYLLNCL